MRANLTIGAKSSAWRRETKGSVGPADLRDKEALKIARAERHFEVIAVDYDVVSSAEQFGQKVSLSRREQLV